MGRQQQSIFIEGSVSRHNSLNDIRDDALWELLVAEIGAIVSRPIFNKLDIKLTGDCDRVSEFLKTE